MVSEAQLWESDVARRRCLREARRILRNREDAEEAVQEAFIRAWRNRDSCRSSPLPWLVQITRNEALRLAARRQRRRASEVCDERPDLLPSEADAGLDRTIDSVATEQALALLGAEDRRLMHLRYIEDLTQGQVAARVGMPEGTVKVRLHRARLRLRGAAAELAA